MKLLYLVIAASLLALAVLLVELMPAPVRRSPPATATPAATPAAATPRFLIRDVRVFDGERVWPRASVRVADGRIAAIAQTLEPQAGERIIEGAGRTLLPGLIDAHVHTWGTARRDALRFGVTTLLDHFTDHHGLAAARRERESLAATDAADLWSAGTLATAAGGHGTQYGMAIPTLAAPAEASAWVAARKTEGSDWIKLVREDLHTYSDTRRLPTLDDATAAAVIAAAQAQGLRAVVHASAADDALHAIRSGADGLVHIMQDREIDDAWVAAARERDAFVVATLSVVAGIAGERSTVSEDARLGPLLTSAQRQTLTARFGAAPGNPALIDTARRNVRRLHAGGVAILAGTDAPNPNTAHGISMHEELAQLVQAGLSSQAALTAATAAPARAFGLADRGRISAGLRADLILVEGDPTVDIHATRALVAVWKNGHEVARTIPTAAATPALNRGMVSDFAQDSLAARDGQWMPTTDQMAGGASTVTLTRLEEGAGGASGALQIAGRIDARAPYPWAGAIWTPAGDPSRAVDAAALVDLVFQVRGDGADYSVMLFTGDSMGIPAMGSFRTSAQWTEVRLPLSAFAGVDLAQLRAIGFSAGAPARDFRFEVDQIELR